MDKSSKTKENLRRKLAPLADGPLWAITQKEQTFVIDRNEKTREEVSI